MDIQEAINLYIEYLIVEKGLSENDYFANEISGFLQHIFHLKDRR